MQGFFSKKETQLTERPDGKHLSCISCGLYKGDIQHPKLAASGKFKKGILNIGEFTTAWDDRKGKQFQSKQDTILYNTYQKLGIDLEEDCLNVNAVMCFPYNHKTGKPRVPTAHETQCCRLKMISIIKAYNPKVIVLFGKVALESVIGHRWKKGLGGINKWRGWAIPDQYFKSWIIPTFSPSYVNSQDSAAVNLIWEQDLQYAINHVDKPFRKFVEPKITVLEKNLKALSNIKNMTSCAFDYETTGLKPHAKGQKIICCSIADSDKHVYVFMLLNKKMKPISEKKLKPFKKFLINKYIPKIAQHCLHAESLVQMEDGSKMRISELVNHPVKKKVLSYNEKTKKVEPKKITNLFKSVDYDVKWFKIVTKDSIRKQGHSMTPDHKVYIKNKGMTRVDEVRPGDFLLRLKPILPNLTVKTSSKVNTLPLIIKRKQHSYSEITVVEQVKRKDDQRFNRYCIEVKDNHNFFTTTGLVNNCKFEHGWTLNKYKVHVKGWEHDTMYWSHIYDNRTGVTGLKFQAYVCFGIDAYDEDVANYIKAKTANSLNKMIQYVSTKRGKDACLKYCAWDSILERRLATLQKEWYEERVLPF